MYDLPEHFPETEIDPGTNLLVMGPPMTGKRRIGFDVLAHGADRGEGSIVVTTKDGGDRIVSQFLDSVEAGDPDVGVVDCVTRQQKPSTLGDDPLISYASSPVDMTGIGIQLSEFLQEFYEGRGLTRNRIMLHSISTLLMYSDLQTVFRFLHVFTGRIQSADALGVCLMDSGTGTDAQTMNTLKQLFDGVVEVSAPDAGEPEITTTGLSY